MDKGVAFLEPWFDGSLILIDKRDPPKDNQNIHWFNWLRPFEHSVWYFTVLTVFVSGWVYQLIEYMSEERNDRPFFQWMMDNLYLSALNSTQNFEYAPGSTAGRFFGFSMAMWALVMTATYTANLASLFVDENQYGQQIESIDHAIRLGIPICTYANTNSDTIIKEKFPKAIRVPKLSEVEAYDGLHKGECGLVAAYKANWLGYQRERRYNPDCDLEWAGRTVEVIQSGFAVKADAGHKCTSLIRDVFNLHLSEMISSGTLADAWEKHYAKSEDIDCSAIQNDNIEDVDEDSNVDDRNRRGLRRREVPVQHLLSSLSERDGDVRSASQTWRKQRHRKLKSGGGGGGGTAGKGGDADPSSASLTIRQMAGTFAFHWVSMLVSISMSIASLVYKKYFYEEDPFTVIEKVVYRTHGPIIGQPPPINTYVKRKSVSPSQQQQRHSNRIDGAGHNNVGSTQESNTHSNDNNSSEMHSLQFALEETRKQLQDSQEKLALALDDSVSTELMTAGTSLETNNNVTTTPTTSNNTRVAEPDQESVQLQLRELGESQQRLQMSQQELTRQMRMVVSMLRDIRNDKQSNESRGNSSPGAGGSLFG